MWSAERLMLTIEADMVVTGNLMILGPVRLDGRFEGTLTCGRLHVGVDGYVKGVVCTDELILEGQIVGTVQARRVHLATGAILEGELVHEQLRMDEAATLVGESRRQKSLEMPVEFRAFLARTRVDEEDISNLETQSRVRRADQAVRERPQYDALRARFPAQVG
jgi:cytoskeletal protein CcmA (bactofilin family)